MARVPTKRIMRIAIAVGTRFPAYATSMGRVLLAGQSEDWLDGYLASADLHPIRQAFGQIDIELDGDPAADDERFDRRAQSRVVDDGRVQASSELA